MCAADNEDLSLSYEVLETARVIYGRHYDGPGKVEEAKHDEEGAAKADEEAAAAAASASSSSAAAAAAGASASAPSAAVVAPEANEPYTMSQHDLGLGLAYTYEILAQWFLEKGTWAPCRSGPQSCCPRAAFVQLAA